MTIQAGKYQARALVADLGVTPTKGTDFVRVVFCIRGGDADGEQVSWDGYFTPNTTERTLAALGYLGCTFPNNDVTDLTGVDTNDVQITVEQEPYVGKDGETHTAARVRWVDPLGAVRRAPPLDAGAKAAFKQRLQGAIAVMKQSAPPATPRQPRPGQAPALPQTSAQAEVPAGDDLPW